MAITLVAAPLIARGLAPALTPASARNSHAFAWAATFGFAAIFWIWHSPLFYDETLRSNVVYWLMHVTTIAAALALWTAVFTSSAALAFLLLFVTGVQMSLLGALLTFAAAPPVFRARVHHERMGSRLAAGSTARRPCHVGASRVAADRVFGPRLWRRPASGRAGCYDCGREGGLSEAVGGLGGRRRAGSHLSAGIFDRARERQARAEDLACLSNPWSFTTSFSNGQKPVGE